MNTSSVILAEKALSGKSTNNVWFVYVSSDPTNRLYCTSPYKAMRLAFLLKKRLGLNISDNILARLSHEIALAKTAPTEQPEPQPTPEKPKKRGRKPKAKSAA